MQTLPLPPNCSASSRSLGSLLATGRLPNHSTPSLLLGFSHQIFALLAAQRPPKCSALSWLLGTLMAIYSLSLPNPGHGHTTPSGCSVPSPWLVTTFLRVMCHTGCLAPIPLFVTLLTTRRPSCHELFVRRPLDAANSTGQGIS